MAAEYSAILPQTIAVDENVIFNNGSRCCKKGFIQHRDDSGLFTLRGARNCNAVYRVSFGANIAVATGGTVEPISVALTINGEALGNATGTVSVDASSAMILVKGEAVEPPVETTPNETTPNETTPGGSVEQPKDNGKLNTILIVGIVLGVLACVAVGFIAFKKK